MNILLDKTSITLKKHDNNKPQIWPYKYPSDQHKIKFQIHKHLGLANNTDAEELVHFAVSSSHERGPVMHWIPFVPRRKEKFLPDQNWNPIVHFVIQDTTEITYSVGIYCEVSRFLNSVLNTCGFQLYWSHRYRSIIHVITSVVIWNFGI